MRSQPNFLERFLNIREQEVGRLLLMSGYLLLIIACYTTTKAVRDSLFVTQIGPAQLPYMYLLIAAAMGVVSWFYSKAVNRIGLHRLIRATSLIAIANLLIFWWAFKDDSRVWFYVLYVWVSLFGALTASQFWLLASHVFNPREARRVFSWVGVGGILGGIAGGGLTHFVASSFGTESLILVCAAMMAVTVVLLTRITRSIPAPADAVEEDGDPSPSTGTLFRQVRESRHLSMMVLLLGVAVIVEAFVDYEYKFVARQSFASKDHLTAFFGAVTFYIGLFSLMFQILLTSRIMKRFGVGWSILMLPLGLLGASVLLALRPALWSAALLQLVDGGFSYSIHRSGMELLYLPIPPQTRNAVKGFIDMFVDRFGRAVGGLLLLLLTAVLTVSIPWLSLIVSGILIAWVAMAVAVRREYLHSFRIALEKKTIERGALQLRSLDNTTVATLVGALSGSDEREVLYAMDLLSNTHPNRWRRQIDLLIQHPSSAVRARTIATLAQWNDPSVTKREFIRHPDYQTARIAAASALTFQWTGSLKFCEFLDQLLHDSSPEVARQAIRTCGNVKYEDAIPFLIEKLADKDLRREARDALVRFGSPVIPELIRRLALGREPLAVRGRIPKVLAYTGKQQAADALIASLQGADYHLGYSMMKALNKMRVRSPKIRISIEAITDAINKEREERDRLRAILHSLEANPDASPVFVLLVKAIHERLEQRVERVFRLLALIYSPQDIYSAYYSCKAKPELRASAVEFLDNLLDAGLKETLVPIIEEAFDTGKGTRPERIEFISREAVLEALIAGDDQWLQVIAAELKGRLRFTDPVEARRNIG